MFAFQINYTAKQEFISTVTYQTNPGLFAPDLDSLLARLEPLDRACGGILAARVAEHIGVHIGNGNGITDAEDQKYQKCKDDLFA